MLIDQNTTATIKIQPRDNEKEGQTHRQTDRGRERGGKGEREREGGERGGEREFERGCRLTSRTIYPSALSGSSPPSAPPPRYISPRHGFSLVNLVRRDSTYQEPHHGTGPGAGSRPAGSALRELRSGSTFHQKSVSAWERRSLLRDPRSIGINGRREREGGREGGRKRESE